MSYIDAIYNRDRDQILVSERIGSKRVYREYPARYFFYYKSPGGKYRSLFGDELSKVECRSNKDYQKELRIHSKNKLFESDFHPIARCLEENYLNKEPPNLHIAFFDIETDFSKDRGFAPPEDPFNCITAITVYLKWLDELVTLAIPPKTLTLVQAQAEIESIPNAHVFETEAEMLTTFLELIEDADILSGWNSEGFDIPYIINRIVKVLGKDYTRKMCLWDQYPQKRKYVKYGKESTTYDLIGRVHLDSLALYRKFTYEERHSWSLDAISEFELGERKVPYNGSLDQLYNNDFRKFIEYNRQDVALLGKLDAKLKFFELANGIIHQSTVQFKDILGAVKAIEQYIINETHQKGFVVQNRGHVEAEESNLTSEDEDDDNDTAAGAYVAHPKKGLQHWIGALDVNSLYPSVIRALNMSPETLIGQLRQVQTEEYLQKKLDEGKKLPEAWEGLFGSLEYSSVINREIGTEIIIDWSTGGSITVSAAQAYKMIFESNMPWILSANGTIFTHEKEGIIPSVLTKWYSDRKIAQSLSKLAVQLGDGLQLDDDVFLALNKI